MNSINKKGIDSLKEFWTADLKAGFNVSLIALPLCLGIALASGFPPMAGLFAAIVGGLVVSRTNGSWVTITGPAAGLIVVNLAAIESLGEGDRIAGYPYALAAIVVSGAFIVLLGFLKFGKLGDFFPSAAVHGMLAAIGIIIIVKQFFVAIAVAAGGHEMYEVIAEMPTALRHANPEVILISVVSLLILIFYPKVKVKWVKAIPAPIWVLLVAIPLEFILDFEHEHTVRFLAEDHKVGPQLLVHLPENVMDAVQLPDFSKSGTSVFWMAVLSITLVTAIESVLSALAVDKMDPEHRKSNLDQDLKGLGFGAMASGAIGGLPMISEIVRSTANIQSGAKTQWSNFFHGLFLLFFVLVAGSLIKHIPLAALAAMLIFTGFRLASPKEFKHVWHTGKTEFVVFVVTIFMVLFTDLLIGVACGLALSILFVLLKKVPLNNLFKAHYSTKNSQNGVEIMASDNLTFCNYLSLKKEIVKHLDKNLIINIKNCHYVDASVNHHLHGLEKEFSQKKLSFSVVNS
ncbi:MAG: SulP family inorganic anion transporter [Flavobacteriales bacterium]|nr:SulP family inorganic anion transporter [Flavobacteriales bacterium]